MSLTRNLMVTFNQQNGSLCPCGQVMVNSNILRGRPSLPVPSGDVKDFSHHQGLSGLLPPRHLPGAACRRP